MTKFEYVTFELGQYPSIAGKYQKALTDLHKSKKNSEEYQIISNIISELKQTYNEEQLSYTSESQEEDFWVRVLAKRSAVELITQGKVSYDTMEKMTCLTTTAFTNCVKSASIIASQLNDAVQRAEKSVEPEDLVPKYMMD